MTILLEEISMAENQKSPTQQAAEAVVNRINAGAQNATTVSQAKVAEAAQSANQTPSNRALELPPALANGGKK
jgi:hypothetical protein